MYAILQPFTQAFMQNALIGAVAIAITCALLSCFVVIKGNALLGDAISHSVFPGVVVAASLSLPYGVGAFCAGFLCVFLIGFLQKHTRLKQDTLIGVVFTGFFALGLVLFAYLGGGQHLTHILFGNLLGISQADLVRTVWVCGFVCVVLLFWYKDWVLYIFDETQAYISGFWIWALRYGLLALLCLAIVAAMQAVGVILVVAMLIFPGITALILVRRFVYMLIVAVLAAVLAAVFGVFLSFYWDSAVGATIVLCQAGLFVLALLGTQIRMWLFR